MPDVAKLRILFLQPDFSRYRSAYYQHQFYEALARHHKVHPYGPGHAGYAPTHTIDDVLRLCPFEPEVICLGAGWERDDHPTEFDIHPAIKPGDVDIPKVLILNKEYKKLDQKFEYIRSNKISKVFTVHHFHKIWASEFGLDIVHFPFGVDATVFKQYGNEARYDFGFSGSLHSQWTPVRARVRRRLFYMWRLKRRRYWGRRIYWGDRGWGGIVTGERYARLIDSSLIWMATPSAIDIVGPRFTEVLASGSLLMCSASSVYEGLFRLGEHFVAFNPNLSDFDDVLFHYLEHPEERETIAAAGREHVLAHHTWHHRVKQWTGEVLKILP